jgi:hemolysin activation/secretion protein
LRLTHRWAPRDAELTFRSQAGVALGTLPTQELFLIGGRGTLPGYPFRAFGGDRVLLGDLLFSADLRPPLLRGRLRGAFGVSALGDVGQDAASRWGVGDTDGLRTSVGFGVGIFYDLLRVDLMRGLAGGGEWELIVETRPSFWPFL